VTITDNADDQINLLVFNASADTDADGATGGELICEYSIFNSDSLGTENSAIGAGRSIFVTSTYGYPYPAVPEGVGDAVPESAEFVGGIVRIDVRSDATGCDLIWENQVRSTAVPKLSISDERIYTVALDGSDEGYYFTVVDPDTGDVVASTKVGTSVLHDTLQMAGNMGADKVYWQGTLSGILRIYPARSLVSGKFLE
jgi:hypothetical protein